MKVGVTVFIGGKEKVERNPVGVGGQVVKLVPNDSGLDGVIFHISNFTPTRSNAERRVWYKFIRELQFAVREVYGDEVNS